MIRFISYLTLTISIILSPNQLNMIYTVDNIDLSNRIIKITKGVEFDVYKYYKYRHLVYYYANKFSIQEEIIHAVISVESGYNRKAESGRGAAGLMQLCPLTQEHLGVEDPFSVNENIREASRYLADLYERFDEDIELVLAAYNSGPTSVRRYGGVPPFPETENYLIKVQKAIEFFEEFDA